jgi:hypothetical protein
LKVGGSRCTQRWKDKIETVCVRIACRLLGKHNDPRNPLTHDYILLYYLLGVAVVVDRVFAEVPTETAFLDSPPRHGSEAWLMTPKIDDIVNMQ